MTRPAGRKGERVWALAAVAAAATLLAKPAGGASCGWIGVCVESRPCGRGEGHCLTRALGGFQLLVQQRREVVVAHKVDSKLSLDAWRVRAPRGDPVDPSVGDQTVQRLPEREERRRARLDRGAIPQIQIQELDDALGGRTGRLHSRLGLCRLLSRPAGHDYTCASAVKRCCTLEADAIRAAGDEKSFASKAAEGRRDSPGERHGLMMRLLHTLLDGLAFCGCSANASRFFPRT